MAVGGTVLLLFFNAAVILAQKADTLKPFRDFMEISNGYKKVPMNLVMEIKNSTNYITDVEDTQTVWGEFYLREKNSYVRVGDFEQIEGDSVALLVNASMQQMILYTEAGPVVQKMKSMMGVSLPDSSVLNLARKYKAFLKKLSADQSVIELQSRGTLYGSTTPRETIELRFDISNKRPVQIITVKSTLLPVDSTQYNMMRKDSETMTKLLALGGMYYLVKEQVATYIFKEIDYDPAKNVPVTIKERVMKTPEGEYQPVKSYENYRLKIND